MATVGCMAFAAVAVALSMTGVSPVYCLLVLVLAPVAIVVGYEWSGHQHIAARLEESSRHG